MDINSQTHQLKLNALTPGQHLAMPHVDQALSIDPVLPAVIKSNRAFNDFNALSKEISTKINIFEKNIQLLSNTAQINTKLLRQDVKKTIEDLERSIETLHTSLFELDEQTSDINLHTLTSFKFQIDTLTKLKNNLILHLDFVQF